MYEGVRDFAEQQVIFALPDSTKVKAKVLSSIYEDENNQNECCKGIWNKDDLIFKKEDASLPMFCQLLPHQDYHLFQSEEKMMQKYVLLSYRSITNGNQ